MDFFLFALNCCVKCIIKTTLDMNHSYSDSDVSLSPTQILERLHMLRQLQMLQQDKLLKQRQLYQESPRTSSVTEIVSQFSASTSFNTFRSLLGSESSAEVTPRLHSSKSLTVSQQDLVEGVSVLNLSQESQFIVSSPVSSRSKTSNASQSPVEGSRSLEAQSLAAKKQISLDDMPILSPKKDFEALIIEKLKNELNAPKPKILQHENVPAKGKKPFLKKGEGMARFGLKKINPVIQSTQALPWKQATKNKNVPSKVITPENHKIKSVNVEIAVAKPTRESKKKSDDIASQQTEKCNKQPIVKVPLESKQGNSKHVNNVVDSSKCELHGPSQKPVSPPKEKEIKVKLPKHKHPLLANKGKTWAAVLTREQDDFLRQLKQTDYYKNFTSPAKSIVSDMSCDETLTKLGQEREMAEQNMFELLENKVDRESFSLNNSFINRFLQGSLECSGESTPLIMQKCLAKNPNLLNIYPNIPQNRNEHCQSDVETCNSEYTCCNEDCSSACSCSCNNTIDETNINSNHISKNTKENALQNCKTDKTTKEAENKPETEMCHNDKEIDSMKENMAEMNAKLTATSELLKDRLRELEDEIETFRKENANLTKMREEMDMEKQKFYEEKSTFEQKFNEEKILSEYYLAEEKEKLTKQKQIYDRQVREMRGRLNKKDKDEVLNLKKEISDLKEEMRLKDAKYTTITARLRNQLKIAEKEKKDMQEEIEKLKKENRRIQHSNDITRRMTNIKYLEEVNRKLINFKTKSNQSAVVNDDNMKYRTLEIEKQSRSSRAKHAPINPLRTRAKSVPNLNVTSRYAKYFSQRDVMSPTERSQTLNIDKYPSDELDNYAYEKESESLGDTDSLSGRDVSDNEVDNSLEKIYMERFREPSPPHNSTSSYSNKILERTSLNDKSDGFFIHRSNSARDSKSLHNPPSGSNTSRSKSPVSILSHRSSRKSPASVTRDNEPEYLSNHSSKSNQSQGRSTSPISTLSNHTYSCSSQRIPTVINRDPYTDRVGHIGNPEPTVSKGSIVKTDLTPTEIRKPDGSKELRFPNGNVKYLSADGKYSKFVYYNGDVKENFYNEGRIKYYYAETQTYHTTHPDGLEVLEFPDGQVEKRYKDGSSEIRLPNGSVRYYDPKNEHVREEWRFPDGTTLTQSASGDRRVVFPNGQVEVHSKDHKRREFPDGTVKLVYNDGTAETRYASGRVRIKDRHGSLIMDSVAS